jgi:hypothetical protein
MLALAFAAGSALSAQAEIIKYDSDVFVTVKDDLPFLNLHQVEGATAWVETVKNSCCQNYRIHKLVIDMSNSSDLVITDFDSRGGDNHFIAHAPGWAFRNLMIRGQFKDNKDRPVLDNISVSIAPDPKSENQYEHELASFEIRELIRSGGNPVADIARLTYENKNLTLKLLAHRQYEGDFRGISHVIEANWMGRGKQLLPISVGTEGELLGLHLENLNDGADYAVHIKYKQNGQEILEYAGNLSTMLTVYDQ